MEEKVNIIKKKEKIMKEYIDKIKDKIDILKTMERQNTLCSIKPIMRQSLFEGDKINDELMNEFENDSDIEQKEDTDKDREEMFNYSNDYKTNAFVGKGGKSKDRKQNKMNKLKQSVQVGMFNNKIREKLRKMERNESK